MGWNGLFLFLDEKGIGRTLGNGLFQVERTRNAISSVQKDPKLTVHCHI